ncbi:unnamed protein product [Durusdinium trenchii]|uniref:Uncharacterized protein n=1 Tax=Durusdinium trenchii TaxID=1381693 RepID=A0ABP0KKS8_9DINO
MDHGAVPDATERGQSSSALHGAVRQGHVDCLKVLLNRGANRDLRDSMGRDPLHWACFWGQTEAASFLIEKGANFGEENRDTGSGAGPLHWAAWRGHRKLVAFLIEQKADPNGRSLQRNTPLHFAAESGHLEMVKDLLAFGSDPDALTDMGETPLTLARARIEKGHSAPNLAQPTCGNHTEVAIFLEGIQTDRESIVISPDQAAALVPEEVQAKGIAESILPHPFGAARLLLEKMRRRPRSGKAARSEAPSARPEVQEERLRLKEVVEEVLWVALLQVRSCPKQGGLQERLGSLLISTIGPALRPVARRLLAPGQVLPRRLRAEFPKLARHLCFRDSEDMEVPVSSWQDEDLAMHLRYARECRDTMLAMDLTKDAVARLVEGNREFGLQPAEG